MTLSPEARERLSDLVELQPTKNSELQERWGLDSGSAVHQYLESELKAYYYRDENSLIRATPEAEALVGGEPTTVIEVPPLQKHVVDVLAGPDEESESVVSVLHKLREAGHDPEVDEVRSALRGLVDKGIATVVRRTVPTFRLAVDPDALEVRELPEDEAADSNN